ncbi:hypothetical protein SCOR_15315 [Sulfidibacter corallicola]|uniref:Uncharacterized protein n=1 Tax=Sulfidibacter corallicola TaxID=2818388 RepID=A0A8A4TYY4_SULCO|nr:hypothetical protein [Sulfidibacter corallicola]QTD54162.1 hypothetical protein J3U87_17085 [Sulfidibacter corallicola]
MPKLIYKYEFKDHVSMDAVESDLALALISAEALFGQSRVLLECDLAADFKRRTLVIQAGNQVGQTVNTLFVGLVHRFLGQDAFSLSRIHPCPSQPPRHPRNRKKRRRKKSAAEAAS